MDGYYDNASMTDVSANDATWAGAEADPRQQTAAYGCLPVPQQGDTYADRNGRKIFLKDIKIRGIVSFTGADSITSAGNIGPARIVIVKDTRTNGAQLNAEDVLGPGIGSDGNASLTADSALMALTNPNGWGRYQVMKDKLFRMSAVPLVNDGTDGAQFGYEIPFKMTIKCNCEVNFNGSAGAVANIVDNSFHLLAACDGGSGAPVLSYVARTSFVG